MLIGVVEGQERTLRVENMKFGVGFHFAQSEEISHLTFIFTREGDAPSCKI